MLSREFPDIKQIRLPKNYGFAEGYNQALKQTDAEFFLLLNSDVEVSEGWLKPLLEYMDSHQDVAACQPKILSFKERNRFEYAGAAGGFLDIYGYPYCRGRVFADVENDEGQYDDIADVLWATGAALMIRAEDWRTTGGLDGRFFAHQEEIDLCWRLRDAADALCASRKARCGTLGAPLWNKVIRGKRFSISATIWPCSTRICQRNNFAA